MVRLGTEALRWNILGLPLLTYVIMNNMMLQTVGETGRASILAAARQGVFFIPAVLILPRFLEFKGVMMAQPTSDVCAFLLAIPLSVGFLRKMRGMEQAEKDLKKNE